MEHCFPAIGCVKQVPSGQYRVVLACRACGHRQRYRPDGATLRWACERGCGARGEKAYATAEGARRYARAFDRDDCDDFGRRPLLSLLLLKLLERARRAG